jgi:uncharacterized protein (TIGR02145 family)
MEKSKITMNYSIILLLIIILISNSCTKDSINENSVNLPILNTSAVNNITQTSAQSGGEITGDGGSAVTERGVCWGINQDPNVNNNKTSDGTGLGSFTSTLTGLTGNTIYHVRAYAININGIAYGTDISFTTAQIGTGTKPVINTLAISEVTQTTASCNADITDDGGQTVTESGVCWDIVHNPKITAGKTTDGAAVGPFTSHISGLTPNTTYYVRAYATNSAGTGYGYEVSLSTLPEYSGNTVTDIDGNIYHTVTIGTQTWMVENLKTKRYNDGTDIHLIADSATWVTDTIGGFAWYNNDETGYKTPYGALYNWYTVNTGILCPTGWHVPSDNDWTILSDYLGGETVAGGKLKEAGTLHWSSPNTGADNSTGFTALPGGSRYYKDASFNRNGLDGYWWSSTAYNNDQAWGRNIGFFYGYFYRNLAWDKQWGLSVRCLKD